MPGQPWPADGGYERRRWALPHVEAFTRGLSRSIARRQAIGLPAEPELPLQLFFQRVEQSLAWLWQAPDQFCDLRDGPHPAQRAQQPSHAD